MVTIRIAAAAAFLSISSAAFAGGPYVGIDAGIGFGRSNDIDEDVTYAVDSGTAPAAADYDDVFAVQYKNGFDVDVVAGWDFGIVRLEGELGHKRSGLKRNIEDDITTLFLGDLNEALNRPGPGPLPGLTTADFQPDGSIRMNTATANLLLDIGLGHGITISGGGGLGRSFATGFGDSDNAGTWQYLFGARYAVSEAMEVGLKYRYFNSGMLNLVGDPVEYAGNGSADAFVTPTMHGRFRSRNVQLGLTYNFR